MSDETAEGDSPQLILRATGLGVRGSRLVKTDQEEQVTAQYELDAIKNIRAETRLDSFTLAFLAAGVSAIVIPYLYLTVVVFRWILYVVGAALLLLTAFGMRKTVIVVTVGDESVEYDCRDDASAAKGFAVSVRQLARDRTGSREGRGG